MSNELNIFCSSIFIGDEYDGLKKKCKGNLSLADHNLNLNLIKALDENNFDLVLVNSTPIPSFPNFSDIFIKKRKFSHKLNADDVDIGYINFPFIKKYSKFRSAYKELKKLVSKAENRTTNVFVYDLHPFFAKAILKLKKKYPFINTCAYLPDMPDAMLNVVYGDNPSIKALKFTKEKMRYINSFDSYVFVTELMKEKVDVNKKPYTVIEGIYNETNFDFDLSAPTENAVLYSGLLREEYGVKRLIDIFKNSKDKSVKLWLCGGGELTLYAKEAAAQNENIEYFGYLNTKDLRNHQNKAAAFINPRKNGAEFTRYSFPSKTMEYLASNKPVVGYMLDGYPEDYREFLSIPGDDSDEALYSEILKVVNNKNEYIQKGKKAREYILKYKSPKNQCKKIAEMLKMQ